MVRVFRVDGSLELSTPQCKEGLVLADDLGCFDSSMLSSSGSLSWLPAEQVKILFALQKITYGTT